MRARTLIFSGGVACATLLIAPVIVRPAYAQVAASTSSSQSSRTTTTQRSAPPAHAHRWEIEGHFSASTGGSSAGGTARPIPTGTFLLMADGITSTRAVVSWFFGDGTTLFNQVATLRGITPRMSSIDLALSAQLTKRNTGGQVGVRIGREMTSLISLEFMIEDGFNSLALSNDALTMSEVARASFAPAMLALNNSTGTLVANPTLNATRTVVNNTSGQFIALGAMSLNFMPAERYHPFLTFGEGVIADHGTRPSIQLTSDGQFTMTNGAPLHQTDTITLRATSSPSLLVMIGGGLKWPLSPRAGLRLEGRWYLSQNTTNVVLDAAPLSIGGPTTGAALLNATNPGLQFSTINGVRSSLSGTPLSAFETYTGNGIRQQMTFSAGYYWRF